MTRKEIVLKILCENFGKEFAANEIRNILSKEYNIDVATSNLSVHVLGKLYEEGKIKKRTEGRNNYWYVDNKSICSDNVSGYDKSEKNNKETTKKQEFCEKQLYIKLSDLIKNIKESTIIGEDFLYNVLISIATTNFIVFSGPSGIGKSKLVSELSENFGGKDLYHKKAVKPNWFDESSIFGFWNPLMKKYEVFEVKQTIEFLEKAYNADCYKFLLFDEMNLARIENYFNEFLVRIDEVRDKDKVKYTVFEADIDNYNSYKNFKSLKIDKDFYDDELGILKNDDLINLVVDKEFVINENLLNDIKDEEEKNKLKEKITKIKENENGYFFDEKSGKLMDKEGNYVSSKLKMSLKFKNNLKVFGTINEDETVASIPNKVLDRCQYVQFEIDLTQNSNPNLINIDKKISYYKLLDLGNKLNKEEEFSTKNALDYLRGEEVSGYKYLNNVEILVIKDENNHDKNVSILRFISELNEKLKKIDYNLQIGYRTLKEIAIYIILYLYVLAEPTEDDVKNALDWQLKQKVFSKLKNFFIEDEKKKYLEEIIKILETNELNKSKEFVEDLKDRS